MVLWLWVSRLLSVCLSACVFIQWCCDYECHAYPCLSVGLSVQPIVLWLRVSRLPLWHLPGGWRGENGHLRSELCALLCLTLRAALSYLFTFLTVYNIYNCAVRCLCSADLTVRWMQACSLLSLKPVQLLHHRTFAFVSASFRCKERLIHVLPVSAWAMPTVKHLRFIKIKINVL